MRDFYISDEVSDYLAKNRPSVAILAPSLDTIPSRLGNAIYCLIEDIAFYSAFPVLVFSRYEPGLPETKIRDRIIYYTRPLKKTMVQRLIGYRLRKRIYGIASTEDIRYANNVYRLCLELKINCLVVEDSNSLLAGLPRNPSVNIILHQHANSLVNLREEFYYSFTQKLSEVVFVSDNIRLRTCAKFPGSKSEAVTVYNGIDPSLFRLSSDEHVVQLKKKNNIPVDAMILFFAGRIHPHKGVREMLEAINLIKDINVIVLLAGELKTSYDYDISFEKRLEELISEKIIPLGNVSQAQIPEYYSISDFVIVPSTGSEGLPKVITEALIMGKPVIASDRGGTTELVRDGENGVIIEDPVTPETVAKAIMRAIDNRGPLAENALRLMAVNSERFSSAMMAKQFDAIFSKFI